MLLVTVNGEEHGLIATLPNNVPDTQYKNADPKLRESLLKRDKDDAKTVKVRYINYQEQEKGRNRHNYVKPGEPIRMYKFIHNYEYTVPMGVVREFNDESRKMVKRSDLVSVDGVTVRRDGAPTTQESYTRIDELIPAGF